MENGIKSQLTSVTGRYQLLTVGVLQTCTNKNNKLPLLRSVTHCRGKLTTLHCVRRVGPLNLSADFLSVWLTVQLDQDLFQRPIPRDMLFGTTVEDDPQICG